VVLEHVPQKSGGFEILCPVLHADGFRNRDLDGVNVIPVPDRFKNQICKPEHQDVLNRFLAEIVVDAVNLAFIQAFTQIAVQFLCAFKIASERLFDDHMPPRHIGHGVLRQQTRLTEMIHHRQVNGRRCGEIVNAAGIVIGKGVFDLFELRIKARISIVLSVIAGMIEQFFQESFDQLLAIRRIFLRKQLPDRFPVGILFHGGAPAGNNRGFFMKQTASVQIEQ